MSLIRNALMDLNEKVERLETIAATQEERAAQNDLFPAVTNGHGQSNDHDMIDRDLLAQKLDSTIEKVEQMLKEG